MNDRKKVKLTKIQKETLECLQSFMAKHSKSPTLAEMAKSLGVKSPQTIADRITGLKKKGLVKQPAHGWRNIELSNKPDGKSSMVDVPVVSSVGADQALVFSEQEYDRFLKVDDSMLDGHRDVVAMKVIGDSMRDADIFDGDYVFVENNDTFQPKNGDLIVAIVEGMTVVKGFYKGARAIELRPRSSNPKYSPIIIDSNSQNFKILGPVITVLSFSEETWEDDDFNFEDINYS